MLGQLRENYPEDFKNYLRMDSDNFDCLLETVRPKITKQDTVMRKCTARTVQKERRGGCG